MPVLCLSVRNELSGQCQLGVSCFRQKVFLPVSTFHVPTDHDHKLLEQTAQVIASLHLPPDLGTRAYLKSHVGDAAYGGFRNRGTLFGGSLQGDSIPPRLFWEMPIIWCEDM